MADILRKQFLAHVAQTSPSPMLVEVARAEGSFFYTPGGKRYYDLVAGVSVSNVGHANPAVVRAVQEQAAQLLDQNEALQGQFEAAQADAQRLAYFRKSEIDPATYEMFLVGYDMLTPTEREILDALADGSSPREISEQRNCSESTIATHRKNIYRKLGIHKAYQLKICIALLRQEREAQN